jgi:hypothetical protein
LYQPEPPLPVDVTCGLDLLATGETERTTAAVDRQLRLLPDAA